MSTVFFGYVLQSNDKKNPTSVFNASTFNERLQAYHQSSDRNISHDTSSLKTCECLLQLTTKDHEETQESSTTRNGISWKQVSWLNDMTPAGLLKE